VTGEQGPSRGCRPRRAGAADRFPRLPARLLISALTAVATACAAGISFRVPQGPWVPDPAAAAAFTAASGRCRGVRTMTAEIAVRGRAGAARIRGRVLAGFERGGSMRLEGLAPFGAPVFILVARANRATLWLPRDRQVLRDAAVEEVLGTIAGLPRTADDLLALLSGCLVDAPGPVTAGSSSPKGWSMVELQDRTRAYLRRDGDAWRIVAGKHDGSGGEGAWSVTYDGFAPTFPGTIGFRQQAGTNSDPGPASTLTLETSQVETNVPVDPAAFDVAVPADAQPLTLDDLHRSDPMRDRDAGGSR